MTRRSIVVALAALLLAGASNAGGFYVTSLGTPSQATANAGANAIAVDASTNLHNAAGMTRLDDHSFLAGIAPSFTRIEFDVDPASPTAGGNGGQQGGFIPITSSHYVHKLHDRVRFGLSLGAISGAALDPSDDWAGRNEVTDLSLFTLSLLPNLAFRVTDWLSVGAGMAITYGRISQKLRAPVGTEPYILLRQLDDWDVTPTASALFEVTPELRLGVVYQGETKFDLEGKLEIPTGATAGLDLRLTLAQAVRTSVYWDAMERLSLMASAGWEDWSAAENLPVSLASGASAAIPLGFRDTWYVSGGGHVRVAEGWTLQTGVRYDSSALRNRDRTAAFPINRVWTFGMGVLHDWSENLGLGFNFVWTNFGDAPVSTGFVRGDYSSNDLYIFGLTLNWKKLPWSGRGIL